jgi:ABC-type lipoprotein release transport system permease subunit
MILGEGARPVVAGVVIGIGAAWFVTSLLEKMLWVEATDILSFTMLPLTLLTIGMLASWIPAMRATHIAPTEVLREG